jgi:hypothetical protein
MYRAYFIFSLLLIASLPAQSQSSDEPVYTVMLGTFMETSINDFEPVRTLGFPYAVNVGPNLYRVMLGGFSDRAEAENIAAALRLKAYDASVMRIDLNAGTQVKVIQLSLKKAKKPFEFDKYLTTGPLYVELRDEYVKVLTGIYYDAESAKVALKRIRGLGFGDAFIKNINSAYLHEVNDFHLVSNQTPASYNYDAQNIISSQISGDVPTSYDYAGEEQSGFFNSAPPTNQTYKTPQSYDYTTPVNQQNYGNYRTPQSYDTPSRPITTSSPEISSRVKRSSVIELQKILKRKGAYNSSLDGYYGNGTKAAYNAAVSSNSQILKYNLLASDLNLGEDNAQIGSLQSFIDELPDNPQSSMQALSTSPVPIAKAYRAYMQFVNYGPSLQVNNLMNAAIRESYMSGARPQSNRFNYNMTYAYNDLSQLILHLRYVHAATGQSIAVPCWLFQLHPAEASRAFEPEQNMSANNYRVKNCGGFYSWQEIRVLMAMAKDLSVSNSPNAVDLAEGQSRQTRYYLSPAPLLDRDAQIAEAWQKRLETGMTSWGARDPYLAEIADAFTVMFYQSKVLLEDYYMDKGMKLKDASQLATATLRAMVGPYMARFV